MKPEEFEILCKRCLGEITQESLENLIKWRKSKTEFEEILDDCLSKGNVDNDFEIIFWYTPTKLNNNEEEEIYRKYLLRSKHFEHEEIVGSFQTEFNESIENIDYLLKAIDNIPEHLSGDDFKYSYIRKCIYAIGAHPEPYNFDGLNKLLQSNDKEIIELTKHQIEKRKRLGQFEKK